MTAASAQAFRRVTTVAWPKQQEVDAKALLLKVANAGHAKIMQEQTGRAGIAPDFDAYANTPSNTNLETVRLPGPIVYRYRYFREIITQAFLMLRSAGPMRSGAYASAHTLYVNGVSVRGGTVPFIKAGDEIMIVNTVPYARKIEVGRTRAGRSFTIQESQSRVYQRVRDRLRSQYSKLTHIDMNFVSLSDAYLLRHTSNSRRRRRDRRAGVPVTYPALVFTAA